MLLLLRGLQHSPDRRNELLELRYFNRELLSPRRCKRVIPGAPIGLGLPPFGLDETLQKQPLKRWIEGPLFYVQNTFRSLLDTLRNPISMLRPRAQRLQDQHLQSSR